MGPTWGPCWPHESCSWWRHQMETFSALQAFCAGNSPVTGEFPLTGEFPRTKGSDAELWCFLWSAPGDLRRHSTHCDVIVYMRDGLVIQWPFWHGMMTSVPWHRSAFRITDPLWGDSPDKDPVVGNFNISCLIRLAWDAMTRMYRNCIIILPSNDYDSLQSMSIKVCLRRVIVVFGGFFLPIWKYVSRNPEFLLIGRAWEKTVMFKYSLDPLSYIRSGSSEKMCVPAGSPLK